MPQVKIKQGTKSFINNNTGVLNAGTLAVTTDTNELFFTHNDGTLHQLCDNVNKSGDTMTGNLNMSGNSFKNAGFEVVASLPTANNFVGRQVTYQGRSYIWNGSVWKCDADTLGGRNPSYYIINDDVIQNTNPFGGRKLYINSLDNALAAADKKYFVIITIHKKNVGGIDYPKPINAGNILLPQWEDSPIVSDISSQALNLFNNNYENGIAIPADSYAKIRINWNQDGSGYNPYAYPYGKFYLSYYYNRTPDVGNCVRFYNNFSAQGVGYKTINFTDFLGDASINYIQQAYNGSNVTIRELEFIVFGKLIPPNSSTILTQIELKLDRPSFADTSPLFTTYGSNKAYYPFRLGTNLANNLTLNPDGTIVSVASITSNENINFDTNSIEPTQTGTVTKSSTWTWQYLTQSVNFLWLKLKDLFPTTQATTHNYLPKIDNANKKLVKSNIYDNGTNVGIGTTNPNNLIQVAGLINFDNTLTNTWLGYQSGNANTTGSENTALGNGALQSNSTGSYNVAIGKGALRNNNGSENLALGRFALEANTSGSFNSAFGNTALANVTTGTHNIGFGKDAGRYITGGSISNLTPNTSIYIGDYTKALADSQTNQIVIGYGLIGIGSNSLNLANTIYATGTNGASGGNVGIGTTNPGAKLEVVGNSDYAPLKISRASNDKQIGVSYYPAGALSNSNKAWIMGLEENSNDFSFYNWNGSTVNDVLYLTNTNNVGIGTADPSEKLQVNGNVKANGYKVGSGTDTKLLTDGGGTKLISDFATSTHTHDYSASNHNHNTTYLGINAKAADSDKLDGYHASEFATSTHNHDGAYSTTDTKNTAGATNTSSKIYLVGSTDQTANPQTYTHDTAYVDVDGNVYSGSSKTITVSDLETNQIVTPTLNPTWTIKNYAGTVVSSPTNPSGGAISGTSIILEYGFKPSMTVKGKWVTQVGYDNPTSCSGLCGTSLPASNVETASTASIDLYNSTTYSSTVVPATTSDYWTIFTPKKGITISGSSLVLPTGDISASARVQVTYQLPIYYGNITNLPIIEADVKGLSTKTWKNYQAISKSISPIINSSDSQYWIYAYPAAWGSLTTISNADGDWTAAFTTNTVSITGAPGLAITYNYYITVNKGAFKNKTINFS